MSYYVGEFGAGDVVRANGGDGTAFLDVVGVGVGVGGLQLDGDRAGSGAPDNFHGDAGFATTKTGGDRDLRGFEGSGGDGVGRGNHYGAVGESDGERGER